MIQAGGGGGGVVRAQILPALMCVNGAKAVKEVSWGRHVKVIMWLRASREGGIGGDKGGGESPA